jgi:SAM-dependent methyltransferase
MRAKTDHLGGYVAADSDHPHGDAWTWTPALWDFLWRELRPKTLLDVGCGEGHATAWFLERDVDAVGVDGSAEAAQNTLLPRSRFIIHDFTKGPAGLRQNYDLVWCCEFVEHVEEIYLPDPRRAGASGLPPRQLPPGCVLDGEDGRRGLHPRRWVNPRVPGLRPTTPPLGPQWDGLPPHGVIRF